VVTAQDIEASPRVAPREVAFDAPGTVREVLAALGRTEDIRFSPSGRRLAFACYSTDQVAVAELRIERSASGPEIGVTRVEVLTARDLREPHGVDFVDDDTLVVGNRGGGISVFRRPDGAGDELTPVGGPRGGKGPLLDSPGSVAVRPLGHERHEVLACNNWTSTITRHTLEPGGGLTGGQVLARKWLDLPDGLALSRDGRWLAVSNHDGHNVLVYAYPDVHEDSDPVAILRGVRYPHGLRFDADDDRLLVADAGAPFVHVFAPTESGWAGARYPEATIRVMDDATFARGHRTTMEGGPKGIDVHHTNVLAVTSACQPLAFFDAGAAIEWSQHDGADDALLRYELLALEDTARIAADAADARARLAEVFETKAWRMLAPTRRAYSAALHLLRRRAG
jgi:Lipoprotein LpqB beta-propeller domain